MECIVLTIAIGMTLITDTPKDIVFEDCNGVKKVSYLNSKQEVSIIKYEDGIYYIKDKDAE